jgi:hypothetical protein
MVNFYKYAVIRLAPDDVRDERINIGVVIFADTGLDLRVAKRLDKARAISAALDSQSLRELLENIRDMDKHINLNETHPVDTRAKMISRIGPLTLSELGTFIADDADSYESRIESLMCALIEPEVALRKFREKRSKLLTQVKKQFKQDRVLAQKDEDISSHRIVSGYELERGLVADLVLKNGAMHIIETVDALGNEDSLRKAIGEIGVAALVLERARMKFGQDNTKARLVYNASASLEEVARPSLEAAAHQGAELTNWASTNDRLSFIHSITSLATPLERKRRTNVVTSSMQPRLFS